MISNIQIKINSRILVIKYEQDRRHTGYCQAIFYLRDTLFVNEIILRQMMTKLLLSSFKV